MIQPTAPAMPEGATNGPIPPLRDGDRLTRAEFERRYEAMPHVKKAELINGVVHMPSPVRHGHHSRPNIKLGWWLVEYELVTPGVEAGYNGTNRVDLENEPQPDSYLLIDPARGGRTRISADDYVEGGPELVGEVTGGRTDFVLGEKLRVYERCGVQEYIVWRMRDRALDWFVSRDGQFQPLPAGPDGIFCSVVFPGLWLDAAALVRGDLARVKAVLYQGVATPEHAAFVKKLNPPAKS